MRQAIRLTALVACGVIALKLLVENVLGVDMTPMVEAWVLRPGTSSALTVVILLAADVFLPVPSSLIMILSGAVFGVVWGSLLSLVGSIGGEWLGFELARRYGHRVSSRMLGDDELQRLSQLFARSGAATVFITRALPIVMETVSIVAGLSHMRRTAFLAASLMGTAPIVVVYAYAGAVSRQMGSLIPGVIMVIAVTGAAWLWYKGGRESFLEDSEG
jgi:uncharacterized membrane protein YdjX (TVP38/TMEM64 family)